MKNKELYNSPDAQSENSAEYERHRNRETGRKTSEAVAKISIEKAKKALRKTIATTLVTGFAAGFIVGGASNEAKHDKAPITMEQIEDDNKGFLELREDYSVRPEEDGGITITYSDYYKGNHTKYTVNDTDSDGKFEHGNAQIENNRAGASFDNEHGLSIEEAYDQLNSGLAQKLSSTGNS